MLLLLLLLLSTKQSRRSTPSPPAHVTRAAEWLCRCITRSVDSRVAPNPLEPRVPAPVCERERVRTNGRR
uniref:Putative secreted protein n=1 Tax=Anopheles darlingi TaxID=43151 RepID=A0A2M4DPP9_ANODA